MKTLAMCALALCLTGGTASAAHFSMSINSDDHNSVIGSRHDTGDARVAITTRDGNTVLMLVDDAIAVQLSDRALKQIDDEKAKKETNFLEELLVSGVKLALGKSVEYPLSHVRNVEYRDGALRLTNDQNKPVFTEMKVNGTEVLRDFTAADATRFVNAWRARRGR